jgi:signal transduction histidine kinase
VRHREAWSAEPWARDLVPALEDALLGVEEARRTVAALREVARPAPDADTSEVARAVELALTMTRHRVRARGRVEVALTDTPPLAIDPARLAQVLVLVIDAAAVALDPARTRDNVIRITTGVAAGAAWIDVADPGAARTLADGSGLAAARARLAPVGATLALDGGAGAVRVRITVPEARDLDPDRDQPR